MADIATECRDLADLVAEGDVFSRAADEIERLRKVEIWAEQLEDRLRSKGDFEYPPHPGMYTRIIMAAPKPRAKEAR